MNNNASQFKNYLWKGLDSYGKKTYGLIKASNVWSAKIVLNQRGIIIKKITSNPITLYLKTSNKVKQRDLTVFSRQLAMLIQAKLSLMQAFDMLRQTQTNPIMISMIEEIQQQIESGSTLSEALAKQKYFSSLYCSLIKAGERSSTLDLMLTQVANYSEKTEDFRKKIIKAISYPTIVFILSVLITFGLLLFVIPEFASIFTHFKAELPFLTRQVIRVAFFFKHYIGIILLLSLIMLVFIKTQFSIEQLLLKTPWLGGVFLKIMTSRFSYTLAVSLQAGLPLLDALHYAIQVMGNHLALSVNPYMVETILSGQSLESAIKKTDLFPEFVSHMIGLGEKSGSLELMLMKISDILEKEVSYQFDTLSVLLEPFIMAILGLIIATLLLAMYAPIFQLGSVM